MLYKKPEEYNLIVVDEGSAYDIYNGTIISINYLKNKISELGLSIEDCCLSFYNNRAQLCCKQYNDNYEDEIKVWEQQQLKQKIEHVKHCVDYHTEEYKKLVLELEQKQNKEE